jgi:undecaprenyl diphosphate synthase
MSFDEFNTNEIPKHIAIIMDGNGRWAQQQGKIASEAMKQVQKQ